MTGAHSAPCPDPYEPTHILRKQPPRRILTSKQEVLREQQAHGAEASLPLVAEPGRHTAPVRTCCAPQRLGRAGHRLCRQFSAKPLACTGPNGWARAYGSQDGDSDSAGRVHKERKVPVTSRLRDRAASEDGLYSLRTWRRKGWQRLGGGVCAFAGETPVERSSVCPRGGGVFPRRLSSPLLVLATSPSGTCVQKKRCPDAQGQGPP